MVSLSSYYEYMIKIAYKKDSIYESAVRIVCITSCFFFLSYLLINRLGAVYHDEVNVCVTLAHLVGVWYSDCRSYQLSGWVSGQKNMTSGRRAGDKGLAPSRDLSRSCHFSLSTLVLLQHLICCMETF